MTRTSLLLLGLFATVGFATLVLVVLPRALLREVEPAPGVEPYSEREARGREVYIAQGCFYCHSQQVRDRSFTTDAARGWGPRATVPGDYVHDAPHLVGTMRTGPDLVNVGVRLPDRGWHLIHLYAPRSVVPWSIMPAFPYLFEEKRPDEVREDDVVVPVSGPDAPEGRTVVAREEALALVDYLLSLRRDQPLAEEEGPEEGEGGAGREPVGSGR